MYDEAIKARFVAFCRADPDWFAREYLAQLERLLAAGAPSPGHAAWAILLDRFVEGHFRADGDDTADLVLGRVGWKSDG